MFFLHLINSLEIHKVEQNSIYSQCSFPRKFSIYKLTSKSRSIQIKWDKRKIGNQNQNQKFEATGEGEKTDANKGYNAK